MHYSSTDVQARLGDRTFPVAAARAWNGLPPATRSSNSLLQFRRETKAHLFRSSYYDWSEAAAHFCWLLITEQSSLHTRFSFLLILYSVPYSLQRLWCDSATLIIYFYNNNNNNNNNWTRLGLSDAMTWPERWTVGETEAHWFTGCTYTLEGFLQCSSSSCATFATLFTLGQSCSSR